VMVGEYEVFDTIDKDVHDIRLTVSKVDEASSGEYLDVVRSHL
jgi:hypothetical protein